MRSVRRLPSQRAVKKIKRRRPIEFDIVVSSSSLDTHTRRVYRTRRAAPAPWVVEIRCAAGGAIVAVCCSNSKRKSIRSVPGGARAQHTASRCGRCAGTSLRSAGRRRYKINSIPSSLRPNATCLAGYVHSHRYASLRREIRG